MRVCCRQVEAEVVSKSKNKIHQTWGPPISGALYFTILHADIVSSESITVFVFTVDVSGRALMDSPPSDNTMAGNEIEDELMLMQPRSVRVPGCLLPAAGFTQPPSNTG